MDWHYTPCVKMCLIVEPVGLGVEIELDVGQSEGVDGTLAVCCFGQVVVVAIFALVKYEGGGWGE
jgi:hypothetical protein